MLRIRSITLKLLASYLGVSIALGFAAIVLYTNFTRYSSDTLTNALLTNARLITHSITPDLLEARDRTRLHRLIATFATDLDGRVTVIIPDGTVIADSHRAAHELAAMENHRERPEVTAALTGTIASARRHSASVNTEFLYAAVPLTHNGTVHAVIRLAIPLDTFARTDHEIRMIIISGSIGAILIAILVGLFLSAQLIDPIKRIIQASQRFSTGDFSRKIIIPATTDELSELAMTLNSMAHNIEETMKERAAHHEQLAGVFNSMTDGVIVTDAHARITESNAAVEKMFRFSHANAQGRSFLEVVRNNEIDACIDSAIATGTTRMTTLELALPVNGVFQITVIPMGTPRPPTGALIVVHEITEIRRLETMRKDFVANVSHELKTPLTAIKGYVETLLTGALSDTAHNREFIEIIDTHTKRLEALVDDLLSLSRLESTQATIVKTPCDLTARIQAVTTTLRVQAHTATVTVKNDVPNGLTVPADENGITHALTNLIENAIKFNTPGGWVTVQAEQADDMVKIIVADSGVGIPAKDVPRIFERFYRVDKARSRDIGGTGLGLSIVKHIVELHGGTVGVESIEGAGSRFWMLIPLQSATTE